MLLAFAPLRIRPEGLSWSGYIAKVYIVVVWFQHEHPCSQMTLHQLVKLDEAN